VVVPTTQKIKMLPPFYQACLQANLSEASYLTLQILILLLQSHRTVQLEKLAALFPQPIAFESRRRNLPRFLKLPRMNYPAASGRGIRIKIDSIVDFGVAAGILYLVLLHISLFPSLDKLLSTGYLPVERRPPCDILLEILNDIAKHLRYDFYEYIRSCSYSTIRRERRGIRPEENEHFYLLQR